MCIFCIPHYFFKYPNQGNQRVYMCYVVEVTQYCCVIHACLIHKIRIMSPGSWVHNRHCIDMLKDTVIIKRKWLMWVYGMFLSNCGQIELVK